MSAAPASIPAVRVVASGWRQDLRAVKVVWLREMMRWSQDRTRFFAALVQPVLFLFVLGTGLSVLTDQSTGGIDLQTFMYPGILATSVVFTAVFAAASIVWDREFGFLREMLVAPIRRGSILVGKALGGATVATIQSILVLALAGVVGVPYDAKMMITLLGELFLLAFSLTALGLVLAARVKRIESMMGLMQMLLMPLTFLSGAMYPLSGLPAWLKVATLLNPITYAVHAVRTTVFDRLDAPIVAVRRLNPQIDWFGFVVPQGLAIGLVVVVGLVLLAWAIVDFSRVE